MMERRKDKRAKNHGNNKRGRRRKQAEKFRTQEVDRRRKQ